jgi:hypothetical protein
MTTVAWTGICLAAALILAATGDLISEEIRGWLDLAPRVILRLAATQLDPSQLETIYHDEWLPELTYALRGAESRPITRLIRGIAYAAGLLIAAHRIARRVHRIPRGDAVSTAAHGGIWLSIRNASGRAITIKSLGITVANGNELSVTASVPEDMQRQAVEELRQHHRPGVAYQYHVRAATSDDS